MEPEGSLSSPNSPPLVPILRHTNSIYMLEPQFLKMWFNVILLPMPNSSKLRLRHWKPPTQQQNLPLLQRSALSHPSGFNHSVQSAERWKVSLSDFVLIICLSQMKTFERWNSNVLRLENIMQPSVCSLCSPEDRGDLPRATQHIPRDRILHNHQSRNLKSCTFYFKYLFTCYSSVENEMSIFTRKQERSNARIC
jgi:hypothetical protein